MVPEVVSRIPPVDVIKYDFSQGSAAILPGGHTTMNPQDGLERVLDKRLRALVDDLPSACDGDVEAVHRTRVASRRMREALPCLETRLSPAALRKARRTTRRLTRALGSVRELDVALEILDEIEAQPLARRDAIAQVRNHIRRRRTVVRERMLGRLQALKPGKLVHKIASRVEKIEARGAADEWREVLALRLERRAKRLLAAIDDAGSLYLPDRLHTVRIAVKKLRYVLELAGEAAAAQTGDDVKALKAIQEILGRMNDLEVLRAHMLEVGAAASDDDGLASDLDGIAHDLQQECRRLHARYVSKQDRLRRLCAEAAGETARQAWPGSPDGGCVVVGRR